VAGKGGRRVNAVQILCTHVCKCIPVEIILGMGGGQRRAGERVNPSMIHLRHCNIIRTFVNVTMYPYLEQQ
jgi:hypothetical protein